MEQPITSETPSRLCYIDAGRVQSPLGELRGLDVLDADGRNLGSLDGIVVDLPARRICYWVVAVSGGLRNRYYLIPFYPARLEPSAHAVRLEGDTGGLTGCREFNSETFLNFSYDVLLAALFSPSRKRAVA